MQPNNNPRKSKSKGYNSTTREPEQPPSYLSSLFKPPEDAKEAEAERDRLYGRTSLNNHNSSSFTK